MNIIVLILLSLSTLALAAGEQSDNTLHTHQDRLRQQYGPVLFANMLFRHGDRTIKKSFPNDPYKDSPHWHIGYGQLTQEGQLRQYKLGQWIRENYPSLVGDEYSPEDMYMVSSAVDRCLMSAESLLAGLYPASTGSGPPFQPIPVHSVPLDQDNMIYMGASCPVYDLEEQKFSTSKYKKALDDQMKDLYHDLTEYTGLEIDNINTIALVYDTLKIQREQFNMVLADWASSIYPEPLMNISWLAALSHTHTDAMKKLRAGPLLRDMISHLVSKAEGTLNPSRKLWMYSGHGETIVAVLHALDLHGPPVTMPSYSSLFVMELRKLKKNYFVTLKYKEGMADKAIELRLKSCGHEACTLQQFLSLTRNMIVNNWTEECALPQHNRTFSTHSITIKDKLAWMCAGIFILIFMVRVCISKRRRKIIKNCKMTLINLAHMLK